MHIIWSRYVHRLFTRPRIHAKSLCRRLISGVSYDDEFKRSIEDPVGFWAGKAQDIKWDKKWDTVLIDHRARPESRTEWFVGGTLNACYNAVDRHVLGGNGNRPALIYHSVYSSAHPDFDQHHDKHSPKEHSPTISSYQPDPDCTGTKQVLTYKDLYHSVSKFAGYLKNTLGVKVGDTVVIYMPMVPEAVIAMLACARIGAIHSVVFGGFAAAELAGRLHSIRPSVIVTASCGLEPRGRVVRYSPIVHTALSMLSLSANPTIITMQRRQWEAPKNLCGVDFLDAVNQGDPVDCISVPSNHPLYVLFTSGTTGQPKGIVRDTGGYCTALQYSMSSVFGLANNDVMFTASDLGWVVGHSYIVYGPLLAGIPSVLFEGKPVGTPDASAYWNVCESHAVTCMFTAPTAIRSLRHADPNGEEIRKWDVSKLNGLFLAGERCDAETIHWCERYFGDGKVFDHWWQTESGFPMVAPCQGFLPPVKSKVGSAGKPVPGWSIGVVKTDNSHHAYDDHDDQAKSLDQLQWCKPGEIGQIVVRRPLPPGSLLGLWPLSHAAQDLFFVKYFRRYGGLYDTSDSGVIDEEGYLSILARTDDVINVSGRRITTGVLEGAIATHPAVIESAVIGVEDALMGHVPVALVVAAEGSDLEQVRKDLVLCVRNNVGAFATLRGKQISFVPKLPKTRSGKVLRGFMRKLAEGAIVPLPSTIEDPDAADIVQNALKEMGYGVNIDKK